MFLVRLLCISLCCLFFGFRGCVSELVVVFSGFVVFFILHSLPTDHINGGRWCDQ